MKLVHFERLHKRKWDTESIYDSITIATAFTKKNKKAKWSVFQIIGLDIHQDCIEVAGQCEDINWIIPHGCTLRTDMFPSGLVHFWSDGHKFKIGRTLSSTDITLIKIN